MEERSAVAVAVTTTTVADELEDPAVLLDLDEDDARDEDDAELEEADDDETLEAPGRLANPTAAGPANRRARSSVTHGGLVRRQATY